MRPQRHPATGTTGKDQPDRDHGTSNQRAFLALGSGKAATSTPVGGGGRVGAFATPNCRSLMELPRVPDVRDELLQPLEQVIQILVSHRRQAGPVGPRQVLLNLVGPLPQRMQTEVGVPRASGGIFELGAVGLEHAERHPRLVIIPSARPHRLALGLSLVS